ncbi:hypothetical protein BD310DRAFT_929839 [Dichomitus squalens]|uniref:Uncharacterized protein n=1 Tax=Dichomitus squalens TaxID=114155 RepID=A0A4Q9PS04_9APHY|nr:hypothetical protein BD310DRAFT_929839 [Dichomitus squalens]
MASALISKLKSASNKPSARISVLARKAKAKAAPCLPRASTVVAGIKVTVAVAATLGLSVMEHAAAVKSNRKECKKISALTEEVASGLLSATKDVEEEDLDEITRLNLAELEWRMQTIGDIMSRMRGESFDEHATSLADHRRALQDAISKFQIMQLTRLDTRILRLEKKQDLMLKKDPIWMAVRGKVLRRVRSFEETYSVLHAQQVLFPR